MTSSSMLSVRNLRAFVFDAYGTLFDVHSVAAAAEAAFPGRGAEFSRVWRAKQLEYTWLQSLMATRSHPREDFSALTAHALDYAAAVLGVGVDTEQRARLLAAYMALSAFPDVRGTLPALAPRPRWILSNGTLAMLTPLLRTAGLDGLIDGILSVDAADIYKPSPRVYALVVDRLRLPPDEIGFVSSNCWDAIGAKAFGFTTFWINRLGAPVDRHGPPPDSVLTTLADLPTLLKSS